MFRKMRRFKQQMNQEDCIKLLKSEPRGVLSLKGEEGYPYGIPMNHWYDEKENKLYFHCAKTGHKIDALEKCDKVSFCVYDQGYRIEGEWPLHIQSVVVFGRICKVEDESKTIEICSQICKKFTSDEDYLKKELNNSLSRVQCLELTVDYMTGKQVKES